MIRVMIVDDHMIIRRGLRQVLSDDAGIEVVAEAPGGVDALRVLRDIRVDVVLLDIAMEGRDGLEVLKQMRAECARTAVLMLSVYPESQFALRAIRNGAAGYLNKGCAPDELCAAIRRAAAGGVYVTPTLAERMALDLRGDHERPPHELLSDREYQVLQLLALGGTVSDIAARLNLSVNTVSTYRARVFDKLGLKSNMELLAFAARHQLIAL